MPVWMVNVFIISETLSREISRRSGVCTIEEGDFQAPLRCARNDGAAGQHLRHSLRSSMTVRDPPQGHLERGCMPVWMVNVFIISETLSREISRRSGVCTIEEGDFQAPLPALEMTVRRGSTCVIRFILK